MDASAIFEVVWHPMTESERQGFAGAAPEAYVADNVTDGGNPDSSWILVLSVDAVERETRFEAYNADDEGRLEEFATFPAVRPFFSQEQEGVLDCFVPFPRRS